MAEPTYRACEILARLLVLATGARISYVGVENIPARGGAVIAINHTSYSTGCRPGWRCVEGTGGCGS
jgi:1-acyl-sn-glycerol-3-phosphate acyltransferase